MENQIAILCSGVALGVYIPGVRLAQQFLQRNLPTKIFLIEELNNSEKLQGLKGMKEAFHKNFSVALTARRMATDILPALNSEKVEALLQQWSQQKQTHFIVFSGYWLTLLERYKRRISPNKIHVELVHVDADYSTTFRIGDLHKQYKDIWLHHYESQALQNKITYTREIIPYAERNNRFVIHGGGWGMGDYQDWLDELAQQNKKLDIVAYCKEEVTFHPSHRYFMTDPEWSPWVLDSLGNHGYPPFAEIVEGEAPLFQVAHEYHDFHELTRQATGIISKPGGSTLIDSLSAATPVIFLKPFGPYEAKNGELWETLGLGISYQNWKASGFSTDILEKIQKNLIQARNELTEYGESYYAA